MMFFFFFRNENFGIENIPQRFITKKEKEKWIEKFLLLKTANSN